MADQHPVLVEVRRPDGSTERVQVGTAVREGDDFILQLGELRLGPATARAAASAGGGLAGAADVFPNYGRSKNKPIRGASEQDLDFYANGARRSLADPGKARFHDKERGLLAAIEAEQARQRAEGGGSGEPPPPGDDDAPF